MAESAITRLRLVGLDQIVHNLVEEAYNQLRSLSDTLKNEDDVSR